MDLFNIYDSFLSTKQELIDTALKQAVFSEERDTGNVRPLVVLKSDLHMKEWEQRIKKLNDLAEILIKGDPVRFKATAKIFNPAPVLFKEVYRVDVREAESTSQSKIDKQKIIKRMRNLLAAEKHNSTSTGDYSKVHQIASEIKTMVNDGEEFYLRRAGGYKDIRCLIYLTKECREPIKVSLSFAGVFIRPSKDSPENFISLPQQSRQLVERADKLDISRITQIKHSLALRGKLYKYSEYLAAKQKPKQPDQPPAL